jgi:hypothetical protein
VFHGVGPCLDCSTQNGYFFTKEEGICSGDFGAAKIFSAGWQNVLIVFIKKPQKCAIALKMKN